uniref:Uncharacterized protein n=1 Tax=viral metagenome TaxID=1070528 RepID=A0A6C0CRA1_9ZZZZ
MPTTLMQAIEALPTFVFKTPTKPPKPHNGWAPARPSQKSGHHDHVARQLFESETKTFANAVPNPNK